jgi:hypothetical protein
VGHYAKAVLDEVFGAENFVNEIVWQKIRTTKAQSLGFGNVHDTIFMYVKSQACPYRKYHPAFKYLHLELRLEVRCSCS